MEKVSFYKSKVNIREVPLEVYIKTTSNSKYITTVWINKQQACLRREVSSDYYLRFAEVIQEEDFNKILNQVIAMQ